MKGLTKMDKQVIEEKASEIFTNYGDGTTDVDIVKIARKMGFIVGNAILPNEYDGFIVVNETVRNLPNQEGNKVIAVNTSLSPEDKNFVIAHELGHYVLSNDSDKKIFAHREHRKGKNAEENDYDFFAACLLMPKEIFKNRLNALKPLYENDENGLVNDLANYFIVSPESVKRRIEEVSEQ